MYVKDKKRDFSKNIQYKSLNNWFLELKTKGKPHYYRVSQGKGGSLNVFATIEYKSLKHWHQSIIKSVPV